MARGKNTKLTDLELCKIEIKKLLAEYNCALVSADEWSQVLLYDKDTYKTVGDLNNDRNF